MCCHEWTSETEKEDAPKEKVYRDANGNVLVDGDDVSVIKDLKIKGASSVVKQGTIVKNIKLIDEDHDIDCKVPGQDRKSTRLNSSHVATSYAVCCVKK